VSEQEPTQGEPERQADDLERRTEKLGEDIDRARQDWESKKADEGVPGARPEDDDAA
jgi:hypothetical protein